MGQPSDEVGPLAEPLIHHAQLPIGIPYPPGFQGPVVDQLQRPECDGQQNLDQHCFKPTDQPHPMAHMSFPVGYCDA